MTKVLVKDGAAKEIRLADGTEIEARKVVVSNLDIGQTINRLLADQEISRKIRRRTENIKYDRACLHWANVALHELPNYKADGFAPDFRLCSAKALVVKNPNYYGSKWKAEIWVYGMSRDLGLVVFEDTRFVPLKAAPGKHNSMMEDFTCPARFLLERQWLELKTKWSEEMIRQWQ